MIHSSRRFFIADVSTANELAQMLAARTWTGCTGFRLRSEKRALLFLNDSFSGGGAQEYAVFDEATAQQIESITFSWCSEARALEHITNLLTGGGVAFGSVGLPSLEHKSPCRLCA